MFQNALFNMADRRAHSLGIARLNSSADTQLCIRGRAARRVLFIDGRPDIMPWDTRFVTSEPGENGPEWAAYETTRTHGQIFAEYGKDIGKQISAIVTDVWDDKTNEVYIGNELFIQREHGLGYCPVIIETVPLGYGSILMDENRIVHEGESIFFLIRDIIPELNRLVSILQTLNMKAVKSPMQFASEEGKTAVPPEYDEATASGAMTSVDKGGGITRIDYGDARRSAEMVYGMMEKAMQEGSVTSVDLGNLQFPLSAVALVEIGEGRDQVYLPRLQAKAWLNQATAEMLTAQILKQGRDLELGTLGHKRRFELSKMEGEYETTYKYFVKSPKTDIARMSVAQAAAAYYDPETILSDILQVEDPKSVMQKRYYYMAEQLSVNVKMNRTINKLLELAEKGDDAAARDAQIMALELGMNLEQVKRGELPAGAAPEKPQGQVLPLLGEGEEIRGMRPGKRAVEEQKTPQEAS